MNAAFRYFSAKNRRENLPDEVLLPQFEKDVDAVLARRGAIDLRRTHYPITYEFAGMTVFPYCVEIPDEENDRGAVAHFIRLQKDTLRFALESVTSLAQGAFLRLFRDRSGDDKGTILVPQQHTVFTYQDEQTDPFVRYSSFYLANDWPIPAVSNRWRQDSEFARQVIGGLDPTYFTRVTHENYATTFELKNFTLAMQRKLLPAGTTMESLIDAKRLYGITMPEMTGYPVMPGKHVCDPIALFWVNDRKTLMPLAIQLTQNVKQRETGTVSTQPSAPVTPRPAAPPATNRNPLLDEDDDVEERSAHGTADSVASSQRVFLRDSPPVFTPLDSHGVWLLAKMHVQCSLVTNHSVRSHLVYCHLVSETIYISMCRNLSVRHPLHAMLRPHFWYLLKLNNLARDLLASPTGILAKLFGLPGVAFTVKTATQDLDMKKHMHFPTHLKMRGVTPEETKEALPDFYFRDDGLKMWNIYREYCADVVDTVYQDEEMLLGDLEVQAWVSDLSAPIPVGCGLENLPVDPITGGASTKEQLTELLTMILYNGSVKHSALNDPQGEYVTFIPNQPMYMTAAAPLSNNQPHITEDYIAKNLPSVKDSLLQMALCMNLTQLGFESSQSLLNMPSPFPASAMGLQKVFERFKGQLKAFSVEVRTRNAQLDFPYPYMDPRTITQSIMM